MLNLNIWNVAFTVINILVLYAFMRHFLVGPVTQILADRKRAIETDLDEASRAKSEALQLQKDYQASLSRADQEAAGIVAEAKARAGEEYQKILDQAKRDVAKKQEEAERTIALEREKALNDLQSSVAGLAMTAAAKLLAQQSSADRDQAVYDAFLRREAGEGRND